MTLNRRDNVMRIRRHITAALIAALAVVGIQAPSSAGGESEPSGTRSLAEVLTSDGNQFDRNWQDYDILTEAVLAVVGAKPDSPVALLTRGDVALTAFLPNDLSFNVLAKDLTGRWSRSEQGTFETLVAAVGVDAIEQVLLYHVIPGATIDSGTALRSDGAALTSAQGGAVTVDVVSRWFKLIVLRDLDPNDVDPVLDRGALDINKGNLQIAHGIYFVLRPLDL